MHGRPEPMVDMAAWPMADARNGVDPQWPEPVDAAAVPPAADGQRGGDAQVPEPASDAAVRSAADRHGGSGPNLPGPAGIDAVPAAAGSPGPGPDAPPGAPTGAALRDACIATSDPLPPAALPAGALRLAEALIFAADRPVPAPRIATVLPAGVAVGAVLAALAEKHTGGAFVLAEIAEGWCFRTAPDLAPALTRVVPQPRRLTKAAMETLAIVAWHQPVTRAEIEELRGAALSQAVLDQLLELALVTPAGRREVPGRPALWATTPRFLEQFGLRSLGELPKREEFVGDHRVATPNEAAATEQHPPA